MWFKNIVTGLTWYIEDEGRIKELKQNENFVEIDSPTKKKEKTSSKRNNPNKTATIECEICGKECSGQRSYTQHRRMAHGIDKDGNKVDTSRYNAKNNNRKKDGDK